MRRTHQARLVTLAAFGFLILGCTSPRSGFIESYRAAWQMENEIGGAYKIEVPRNRLQASGAISVWTGLVELLRRSSAFDEFESSLPAETKRSVIRQTLLGIMEHVGSAYPFDGTTTSQALGGKTFPWKSYMTIDEYRRLTEEYGWQKSVFAQKAWWIKDYDSINSQPN